MSLSNAEALDKLKQYQNAKHWRYGSGYDSIKYTKDEFPYRMFGVGKYSSFRATLKVMNQNVDYLCSGPSNGFKVSFHTPYELPQIAKHHFHVAPKKSANFLINPVVFSAADELRMYRPETRQCFFESERNLKYFRIYTQANCFAECLSNYTLAKCGCVKFSMASE